MPRLQSSVVFFKTQQMAIRNKMGEMMHPCLTPDLIEPVCLLVVQNDCTFKPCIKTIDEGYDFFWHSLSSYNFPKCVSVNTVKGILAIYEMNIQQSIPFYLLLYDVFQSEYFVNIPFLFSKSCLFLSQDVIYLSVNSVEEYSAEDFVCDGKQSYSSPIITATDVSFLGQLHNELDHLFGISSITYMQSNKF